MPFNQLIFSQIFPWKYLGKNKLVKWHNLNDKSLKKLRLKKLSNLEEKQFLNNIYSIGYNRIKNLNKWIPKVILDYPPIKT